MYARGSAFLSRRVSIFIVCFYLVTLAYLFCYSYTVHVYVRTYMCIVVIIAINMSECMSVRGASGY